VKRYLVIVWNDIEPELRGPYRSEAKRLEAAQSLHRKEGEEHCIFALDIEKNKPTVWAFASSVMGNESKVF